MAIYRIELTPVTPLHIGSGEELPGYSYYLDDFWYVYRIERVLEALPPADRARIVEAATRDVMDLGPTLLDYGDTLKRVAEYVGGYSETALQQWEKARETRGQALVSRFIHSQNRVYIPGSSLKGALRTALLFGYADAFTYQRRRRDDQRVEADVFGYRSGKVRTDPFRFLKISDSDLLRDYTDLRTVTRYAYHKDEMRWDRQIETLVECTQADLSRVRVAETDIALRATLTIQEDAYGAAASDGADPWRFGVGALLDACRHFAAEQLAAESNYVQGHQGATGAYQSLQSYAAELPDHAALLRLGFGTGRDSKTVNYLQPSPEVSTSRLLVDDVWPLGWVEMRVFTPEGRPFAATDDLAWTVPPLKRTSRRTTRAEKQHLDAVAAQLAAKKKEEEEEKAAQERQSKLAGDVMAFLNKKRKNDGGT